MSNDVHIYDEKETIEMWQHYAEDCKSKLSDSEFEDEESLANNIALMDNFGLYTSKDALRDQMGNFHDKRILFNLILDVYSNDGYGFPRKVVMEAKRIAKDIPEEERLKGLPDGDVLTVYRADRWKDMMFASYVKCATSWTVNKNVAIWFAYRYYKGVLDHGETPKYPPLTIWKGEIQRNKIIAYLTERSEFEVLQHRNVKNLQMLPEPTHEEIEEAFAEHLRYCADARQELNTWAKENGYCQDAG